MPWLGEALAGAIAIALTGLIAYLNNRSGSRNSLVDQLQEEIARVEGNLNSEIARREKGERAMTYQFRAQDDYINMLRNHIAEGKPPPPPEWPPFLRGSGPGGE